MQIRDYQPSDYTQLINVLKQAALFDESYDTKQKLETKIPCGSIIVAEENEKIVGAVFFTWDNWDSSIYRLAVKPENRKQGIGTLLLEEAERRLRQHGADVSSLRTDADNEEIQEFFRKRGYRNVGKYADMEKKL